MKNINRELDFLDIWSDVRPLNTGCLEDYQTELSGITLEQAEQFLTEPNLPLNLEECYKDQTEIHFSFGTEGSGNDYVHIISDLKYGGAITYIEKG